ncbi:MAG TPA: hypothetical protein VJU77_16550 [Chthoniobacterales bacterium]|nr:hypothetical protein [Chthoniobacterales bacterium]
MKTYRLLAASTRSLRIFAALAALALAVPAHATFHFMQIEQVIGGVNGDTTAQAVQLRMRFAGQNLITGAQLVVVDAAGNNPVTLITFPSNVTSGALKRILIATSSFANYESTPITTDFTMTNPIPASYLAAGRLRYEKGGLVYWSVSWGGASYTGPNTGTIDNDMDGDFAPPFGGALPSTSTSALLFTGGSTMSTNNAADYSVTSGAATFTNNSGASTVLTVPTPPASTLRNISTRLRILTGDNALIGGMIATGTAGKRVIVRAIGPSLTGFGVPGALANPTLDLFQGSTLLMSNDDWQNSTQQAEISATGLAPSDPAESAIIWTLTPNQGYTAVVRGLNNTTGTGLVEVYDLDSAAASKLGNISTRGFVDVEDNVMIAGLIVGPSNGGTLKILVRALGPTLGDFGVSGFLANPTLDLVNSSGTVIRSDDNWQDDPAQSTQIQAAGLAPGHAEEAALVETLAPGSYTAVVRGNSGTTGVGLVEAYNIP